MQDNSLDITTKQATEIDKTFQHYLRESRPGHGSISCGQLWIISLSHTMRPGLIAK